VINVETLAFYSYIDDLGRSLLLAHAARYLATHGMGVVALDLAVEAPTMHYKLARSDARFPRLLAQGGVVPYLAATAQGAALPPPLENHVVEVPLSPAGTGWLRLMPAGPAPERAYWAALKELGERLRIEDASGQGLMAVLDLQSRIEDELQPDYLLIEAPSGVSQLGGVATSVLADTVVCTVERTQESVDGTLAVIEALKAAPRPRGRGPVRIVPVLSELMPGERIVHGFKRLADLGESMDLGVREGEPALFSIDEFMMSSMLEGGRPMDLEVFQRLFPNISARGRHGLDRLEAG
jgi:hypothetical protein